MGVAPLTIAVRRYIDLPSEIRLCLLCRNSIEDETHVKSYNDIHNDLRETLDENWPLS